MQRRSLTKVCYNIPVSELRTKGVSDKPKRRSYTRNDVPWSWNSFINSIILRARSSVPVQSYRTLCRGDIYSLHTNNSAKITFLPISVNRCDGVEVTCVDWVGRT